jgi:hypothetical protein
MPNTQGRYGWAHRQRRARLLEENRRENGGLCVHCMAAEASVADHQPPLALFSDPSDWEGVLVASCRRCSNLQAGHMGKWALNRPRVDAHTKNWLGT